MAGTLKVVVVDPLLCIGFAGIVDPAHAAIRRLLRGSLRDRSIDRTLASLLSAHEDADQKTDFLVGSVHEMPRLFRVAEGEVQEGPAFLLGSRPATELYQRLFHTAPTPNVEKHPAEKQEWAASLARAHHAWLEFERLGDVDDVGDFLVHVASRPGEGFNYTARGAAYPPHASTSATEWTTLPMGSAADGGYSYSILRPSEAGIPLIGVHVDQGAFGLVLSPALEPDVVLIEHVSGTEFMEEVRRRFAVQLVGFFMGPQTVPASS